MTISTYYNIKVEGIQFNKIVAFVVSHLKAIACKKTSCGLIFFFLLRQESNVAAALTAKHSLSGTVSWS